MARKPIITRSVGFYLIEGFWADKKPDYSMFSSKYWVKPEFWKLMNEEVVRYKKASSEIVVYRDGLITYTDSEIADVAPDSEVFKRMEKYTEILNALYAVLVSTFLIHSKIKYHTHFEVNHHHLVPLTFEDGVQRSMSIPQKSVTNAQIDKRLLNNVPSGYEDCILICWIQIEVYLFIKLNDYMKAEGSSKFNEERRNKLNHATSSQVVELLEVSGNIARDVYELLSKVRKVRNKIVHEDYSATIEEASNALKLLEIFITEESGQTIQLNTGITMSLF